MYLLITALLVAAPVENDTKDEEKIQGNWTVVSREFIGKKAPEAELKAMKVTIKDGTITMDDGEKKEKIPYKLDPSKKPKAIDLANTGIENKETTLAIYELDGDTLRICWSEKDPEHRATKFASDKDSGQTMIVFKREKKEQAKPPKPKDGPLGMKFVPLPQGSFYMGWDSVNKKATKTEIKTDFEIAVYTVTQGQWQELMGNNPSWFSRAGRGNDAVKDIKDEDLKQFPVEMVSWDDAQKFIKKLNEQEKGKGWLYRLPTEAEWEYACRGGATSEEECSYDFYFDKPTNDLSSKQANFNGNLSAGKADKGPNLKRPTKVGSYAPNKLGLHDMHGNVWQWCADLIDPKTSGASGRASRGGSWRFQADFCRTAFRNVHVPDFRSSDLGFRIARVPVEGK